MHVVFSPVSDEELVRLSSRNPGWRFERDDDGTTIVSPNYSEGGAKSGEAYGQLRDFARSGAGGRAFDASAGFTLASGAVRSPDASWLSPERIAQTPPHRRVRFWRVCPDVVVEVASPTDAWADVCAKIDMYVREGATYAIALDPETRRIYERGIPPRGLALDAAAILDA
jgi:Uma2 family endonuclease